MLDPQQIYPAPKRYQVPSSIFGPPALVASTISQAIDSAIFPEEDFMVFLFNRNWESQKARKRSRWFLGRLYNRLAGIEPHHIVLTGAHIEECGRYLGIKVKLHEKHREYYFLYPLTESEKVVDILRQRTRDLIAKGELRDPQKERLSFSTPKAT